NPTTVDYTVTGGTATIGVDYILADGTATIPPTEISTTIQFDVTDDQMYELDETIIVTLSNPTNANLGTNQVHTYTILNDDPKPTVEFAIANSNGSEGTTPAFVAVSLSDSSTLDVTVDYFKTGGTATSGGVDYTLVDGTLLIPAGDTVAYISIAIVDDSEIELEETIDLLIANVNTNGILGVQTTHTFTINDNDYTGFSGPGGVGDTSINKLWLSADTLISLSGSDVLTWGDASGNSNDAINLAPGQEPNLVQGELNGKPIVRFDDKGGTSGDYLGANLSLRISGSGPATVFMVAKNTTTADQDNTGLFIGQSPGTGGTVRHYGIEYNATIRFNNGNRIFDDGYLLDTWRIGVIRNFSGAKYGEYEGFINGNTLGQTSSANPNSIPSTVDDFYYLGAGLGTGVLFSSTRYLDGDMAEIIVYNTDLNEAQRIIVENYLAAKYNLTVTTDLYAYEGFHGSDVAGIGQVDASNRHTAAQSAKIFKVNNANDLGNAEYLLFGHDNLPYNTWLSSEVPGSLIRRIQREWRIDKTEDVGAMTVALDTSLLNNKPAGYEKYVLLVDADGDFSIGADQYPLSLNNDEYVAYNISFNDGDFVTFGVIRTEVQFSLSTSNSLENVTPVAIDVELNYPIDEDFTVDYSITGGTATGGGVDYDLSDGTITILAGNSTGSISVVVVDDANVETDETIILTLSNPSIGFIGNDTTHTFTINDNDNPRTAEFESTDSANLENISPINIKVILSEPDPANDSKIAYAVTGGTATGGGVDFTLPADTLVIPAGSTQGFISLQITDDSMNEPDETVIISLTGTGSLNVNLGTNITFTDTIQDNDLPPTVQFSSSTSSGAESFQTVDLAVELSAPSGKDINVDYDVTGGSATSGVDYSFTPGTLTIPAGSTTDSIRFTVVDDAVEEPTEDVVVTLSNPVNVTLGGNTSNFYSILDDDGLGWTGPGGIADSTQNKVWLSSTYAPGLNDGDPVSTWEDQTGNSHDATQTGAARPTYLDNPADNWNDRPVVRFNSGFSQYLGLANHPDLNTGGPYDKKTIIVAFRTGIDVTTRQVLYEEGGTVRGLNIYIDGGLLYISGWNEADDDGGATTPWAFTSVTSPINANTPYFAMLQFNFTGVTGDVTGWLNGDTINVLPGAGRLFNHPGNIGVGAMNNGSVFHDGPDGGYDHYFNGNISEVIINNIVYNTAQINVVNNYLGAKYNIAVTNDYFDHQLDYSWELFGIGQKDANNSHNIAQGSGIIRIDNPSSLDDGDYLLIGHDNASIGSWITTGVPDNDPNFQRVDRVWRADDKNNSMGTVRVSMDNSDLAPKPFGFTKYVLLVNSSSDFTTGSEVVELPYNASIGMYSASNIDLSGDKYFTIGVIKPAIEFSLTSSNGGEAISPVDIEVRLNYRTSANVTADYAATGGTATSGNDYTLTPGQIIVPAGSQTATFQLTIINDTDPETDETVIMTLSNPGSGHIIGNDTTHTYTINDDDNSRWIQFTRQDSSNLESVDPIVIQVHINEKDLINDTKVAYEVTGGTATGGGVDFTLAADTVIVAAGDTLGNISISINNDILDEADETIIITLSGPVNANLGDTTQFTYTILDDDVAPSVQFSSATSSGAESFSPVRLYVDISAASGQDIILYYSASGGTAINGGIDYTIFNPSSITIAAGSVLDSLEFSVFNDIIEEGDETIIVTLDSITNGTLGGSVNHTYTIYDDDGMGWVGPGGVSDGSGYQTWLKSNAITGYSDGDRLNNWADASGNGNNATAIGGVRPVYNDNPVDNINNRPVVNFSGGNYYLEIADGADFNTGGPYTRKTLIVAFQTGGDVTARQVIYEQGGGTRGLNFYIEGGNLFIAGWNEANDDGGATTPWVFNAVNIPIGTNETHYAVLDFNSDSTWIKGYVDGALIGTINGVGKLFNHSGDIGLGAMNDGSRFASGSASGNGYYFTGKIVEFLSFNRTLNEAQKIIIENYFGAKYAIGLTNDKYNYEGSHNYEVFGIGRESSGNTHIIAQGSGIIRFDNPGSSDNGDYLIAGHDNGDISSWIKTDVPFDSIQRVTREWKVGEVGDIGTIRFSVDTTSFAANPAFYETFVLLVDTDGDGDFTTGIINFYKLDQRFAELARGSNIDLDEGDVFTIGIARNISIQTGDWNDPATWLVSVPESDESVAIMNTHVVTLTADASIGALTIATGGELQLGSYTLSVTQGTIDNSGTFTAQTGTVEYSSSGSQCISPLTYYDLSISGTGIKTLCGNVDINHDFEMLGLPATLYLDADVANNYTINIAGDWRTRGTFLPQQGEVIFDGGVTQQVLRDDAGVEEFFDFTVDPGTSLSINHNLILGGTLTMNGGNIDLGTITLTLGKSSAQKGTLTHNSGTIIGKFRRWVNSPGDNGTDLIFPVGVSAYYRPLVVNFDDISGGGTLTGEFIASDPGNSGLPLEESGVSIHNAFTEGYWPLTSGNGFAFTGNYDIDLVADGFTSFTVDTSTRVIARINSSSDWELVGTHVNAIDTLIQRDDLTNFVYQYGIGSTDSCAVSLSNCPSNITVDNDAGVCGAIVTWTPPTPNGNCSGVNMTSTHNPGDFFAVGITTVTYYVNDAWGSADSCKFDVTVNDVEDPSIICPSDINQNSDAGVCDAYVTVPAPVTSDNCPGETATNSYNGTADASDTYPVGTTVVTWTVTDGYGNFNNCIQNITVNDNEDPTIS
ncbi:MAG: HYR domain-containing protein, partial [Bacteroidales bacterium]|nr:HYR domain-containing protein [Bacteroidales bacterium]